MSIEKLDVPKPEISPELRKKAVYIILSSSESRTENELVEKIGREKFDKMIQDILEMTDNLNEDIPLVKHALSGYEDGNNLQESGSKPPKKRISRQERGNKLYFDRMQKASGDTDPND